MRRFPAAAHQPPKYHDILSDQARVDMESTIWHSPSNNAVMVS
jgi:hypothetical protein